MPVSPTVLQRHPIETRHEVEFRGPGVAMHDGKAPGPTGLVYDDLGGGQYLTGRVVIFDDKPGEAPPESTGPEAEDVTRGGSGTPCLYHKSALRERDAGPHWQNK